MIEPQASPSWSTYQHLSEVPLSRWIDLTVDGYLKALAKTGNPPEDELRKAEAALRIQYADAIGDHEYRMYCNTMKEVTNLELTVAQVQELTTALRTVYVEQFAKELNRLLPNSNLVFDVTKPDKYDQTLQRALNRSKHLKILAELKRQKLATLEQRYSGQDKKATREYYMSMVLTLSDAVRYPLAVDEMTVWEFCERIKRHNRQIEALTNKV